MGTETEKVVFPGEKVVDETLQKASEKNKVVVGPGLRISAGEVFVTRAGILKVNKKGQNFVFSVENLQRQYTPATDEPVVGIVTKKSGDYFKVDIQAGDQAMLHFLSFESATKKNRPDINVGDAIFGRLVVVSPHLEPELVCVDKNGKKGQFCVLPCSGFLFRVSLHLVRKILSPSCPLLNYLGKRYVFEKAIGMNGIIWIRGANHKETVAVVDAILKAETMSTKMINLQYKLE